MTKILSITLGGMEIPSSNFRMRCYYPYLDKAGFQVTEVNTKEVLKPQLPKIPKINALVNILGLKEYFISKNLKKFEEQVKRADIVWVNKAIHERLFGIIKKQRKKIIFDIDDAIWQDAEEIFRKNLEIVETAIVGNQYLAEEISKRFKGNVVLIPTTIDISDYAEIKNLDKKPFRIGWLGSSFTNEYLLEIAPAINKFLKNHVAEFHIISGGFSGLKEIFPEKTSFHEWREDRFISQLYSWEIGIMPMPNSEWVKGKCSFKMLQYMAAELPVMVSPYGLNAEILAKAECGLGPVTNEEWLEAFEKLYADENLRKRLGKNGRLLVENEFTTQMNFEKLKNIFLQT